MKRCPVCNSPLTDKKYEEALGILETKEKVLKAAQEKLAREKMELNEKLKQSKLREKAAKKQGVDDERARTKRLLAGKEEEIQKWKERVQQLQRGTTPQTEGLEFEDRLVRRLQKEFGDDLVEHKGKGGDILHTVKLQQAIAGIIVYECKRTPSLPTAHVDQALDAKKQREADFAVLVTTAKKKGFNGFAQIKGVLVVSPLAVIPLAALLRQHLFEMMRAKIDKEQRAIIANKLVEFVTSPQFKNPIEEVIQSTSELQEMVKDEAKEHVRIWQKRWNHYQTIKWDSSHIRENLNLVLRGEEPKLLQRPKDAPLNLLLEAAD